MSKKMEDMRNEVAAQRSIEFAIKMINKNNSCDEISEIISLTVDAVKK